ncbi:TNT domain-containing protein [Amycolatopsis sp. cg5]|uniref:TNT domain-containing protein n=1 Tax=Amycolatopsis sp. cg5 TaxID=3238802 RepID=UPI0035267ADB
MGAWRRPELPEGPLRELNLELHRIHAHSGYRSSYQLAAWLKARAAQDPDRLDGWSTPSHTSIHKVLTQPALPNRALTITLVEALIALGRLPDGRAVLDRVEMLWAAAFEQCAAPPPGNVLFDDGTDALRRTAARRGEIKRWFAELRQPQSGPPAFDWSAEQPEEQAWPDMGAPGDLFVPATHSQPRHQRTGHRWPIEPLPTEPPLTLFVDKTRVKLAAGTQVDRFGEPDGNLTYAAGTPFEERSLPPEWARLDYHVYQLQEPFDVLAGVAIPWFGQPGGGTAYLLPSSIDDLLAANELIEITDDYLR